jgi:NADH-quinone oxidoreductase subunit J
VIWWLFLILSVLTVMSASAVIASRSPMYSAMALVATFFFLAGIYALLLAHTIAVLQILVYAGAIMVLFLFVIMLLSLAEAPRTAKVRPHHLVGVAVAAGLFFVLVVAIVRLDPTPTTSLPPTFGTLQSLGAQLYTQWLLPFEAVSLLLLVAMVGAVVVAKSRV